MKSVISAGVHTISGFAVRPQMFAARNAATWSSGLGHVRVSEQAAGIERGALWIRIAPPIILSSSVKASSTQSRAKYLVLRKLQLRRFA